RPARGAVAGGQLDVDVAGGLVHVAGRDASLQRRDQGEGLEGGTRLPAGGATGRQVELGDPVLLGEVVPAADHGLDRAGARIDDGHRPVRIPLEGEDGADGLLRVALEPEVDRRV